MSTMEYAVLIAIPVYQHSTLVVEALESALTQEADFPITVLLVIDGCPFPETAAIARAFQSAYGERFHYIIRKNGGLSAARNTAINYALANPRFTAVYLLDSDNRLQPTAIKTAFATLLREHSDWVYPNIDMFGLQWYGDYGGPYSLLAHTFNNICEAGSLVHRRVFAAGVRFDETMKSGFEDWDFWLSAAEKGFRGVNEEFFGFLYRKRFESMLADSERERNSICDVMRRKHKWLFNPQTLVTLEHHEAPRYVIFLAHRNEIRLTSDPTELGCSVDYATFAHMIACGRIFPSRAHVPAFFVWTSQEHLDELNRLGMARWAFWDMERQFKESIIYSARIQKVYESYSIAIETGGVIHESAMIALQHKIFYEVYFDNSINWLNSIIFSNDQKNVYYRRILHYDCHEEINKRESIIAPWLIISIINLRALHLPEAYNQKWLWRNMDIVNRYELYQKPRALFKNEPVFPVANFTKRHIGFILPIADFGGVERVTYNMAREMKRSGFAVHLFIFSALAIHLPDDVIGVFDTINFVNIPDVDTWDGNQRYLGTSVTTWHHWGKHEPALAMMAWLDVIVNSHSASANALMAHLRRFGVRTVCHLHLFDRSILGRSVGHPFIGIGHEHAYDVFLGCSHAICNWLAGQGIPTAKILPVPNGPGYTITAEAIQQSMSERRQRAHDIPLRVLFMGRIDRQKGIRELIQLLKITRQRNIASEWRVLGKSIISDDEGNVKELAGVLEPPVYSPEELNQVYRWADVFVLLSGFEGLPLTLIEAAKHGVVSIATDVGAVNEVVIHEQTGFLLPLDDRVEQACAILARLAGDRFLLRSMSESAAHVAQNRDWSISLNSFVMQLEQFFAARPVCPSLEYKKYVSHAF